MEEDLNRRLARIESAIELMREDLERQAGIQTQTQSLMVELMEVLTVEKESEPLDQLLRSLIGGLNRGRPNSRVTSRQIAQLTNIWLLLSSLEGFCAQNRVFQKRSFVNGSARKPILKQLCFQNPIS